MFRVAHENITERYVWRENSMCDMGTWDVGFGHGNDMNLNIKKNTKTTKKKQMYERIK